MEEPGDPMPTNDELAQLLAEAMKTTWDDTERQRLSEKLSKLLQPLGEQGTEQVVRVDFGQPESDAPE